jgi:anthranilate synthase component 2
MKKILLIDNFDSFTYNLYYLIQDNYDGHVEVIRNNEIDIDTIASYEAIVISPGPGTPANSGMTMEILSLFYDKKPILGICLGMQCINEFFGGETIRAPYPIHGKQHQINSLQIGQILVNVTEPILVARYHSLIVNIKSSNLAITATTDGNLPMIIEHKQLPIFGIQFHPESFLTPQGDKMIRNFLRLL